MTLKIDGRNLFHCENCLRGSIVFEKEHFKVDLINQDLWWFVFVKRIWGLWQAWKPIYFVFVDHGISSSLKCSRKSRELPSTYDLKEWGVSRRRVLWSRFWTQIKLVKTRSKTKSIGKKNSSHNLLLQMFTRRSTQ